MMCAATRSLRALELWAGVECTVNRVGEQYFDQVQRTGHALRIADLDRLAELGVDALRYPVLWERTAPSSTDSIDWSWSDERLARLRCLKVSPIVGLVHHGSGPPYTNLLDPDFPEKLATFASAVARRYPWVTDYTPLNEPLTTARFSCLYGHWYPHLKDPLAFARATLLQCRAIVLAMNEIRRVNSDAQLIQTEDLGKSYSTPTLAYQAEFENERRWLTYDLLCGKIVPGTALWEFLTWVGIDKRDLEWFLENVSPPDVIGINHYITSERFLDERMWRYPAWSHGGNGRHSYADVEAVRVCAEGNAGPRLLMQEAWNRYGLPLAITEAHLGCTREEQLRWLRDVWDAAIELRNDQIDVRAVTAWSAFGALDWNNLLTTDNGSYEPGIFDLRSPSPRPTALAEMVRSLAAGTEYDHPILDSPGWWRRLDRFSYPPVHHRAHAISASVRSLNKYGRSSRPLLITGAAGTLARAFARLCEKRGLAYYLLSRQDLDIADVESVSAALNDYEPWAIVNAAGYVRVDAAEGAIERCMRENVTGPLTLARACAAQRVALVTFSSDLVFDGQHTNPYLESDPPLPLNIYGRSKVAAEVGVLLEHPSALVIRTSAFFGPWDEFNFVNVVLGTLARQRKFSAAHDQTISPTYVPDLVNATLDLLIDGEKGIWHLANTGTVTWSSFAQLVAKMAGYDSDFIDPCSTDSLRLLARRPKFSALGSERASLLPTFDHALERFFIDRQEFLPAFPGKEIRKG